MASITCNSIAAHSSSSSSSVIQLNNTTTCARLLIAGKQLRDDCALVLTPSFGYYNRSMFLQMLKTSRSYLQTSETAMKLFFSVRKSSRHVSNPIEKRIFNFAIRAWNVLFQQNCHTKIVSWISSLHHSTKNDNISKKKTCQNGTKDIIIQIALENIEKTKCRLRKLGHTVPSYTTPELRALQDEILVRRPSEAKDQLRSILPNVSQTDLDLMETEMRAQMYEMYFNCYISWRTNDMNITFSTLRKRKRNLDNNSVAPAA